MSYTFRGLTLPDELEASIRRYVEQGVPTGDFLQACIENDLMEACGRADERNIHLLPVIAAFLYNHCPMGCHGSKGAMGRWVERIRKERKEPA